MYTGKTEQPCCLCDDPDTAARVDLPPAAIPEMANSDPIAWQDVEGEVSIHFCASDWELVRDLVLDLGQNPLGKCNVARASFDLREDFEALLNDIRDEPDHSGVEADLLERSERALSGDGDASDSERVQALLVQWVLDERAETGTPAADGE
ncbi:hypothetical protein [Halobacterium jilantaiense]|uniref:DUF7960 domain-containing protein n=1 Tax=Halobacterium jilantaiense TaxID=355548 RepID=A0A1I0QKS2_9EURY|nr:hypothetical protein [Halobacterium jilantaiense]SEW27298.1 hypothetical protein SAMN04487945_2669 [Halobacterium jilantaiense]